MAEHAWVTFALNDEDSIKALVLARSLRQVFTLAKIVVMTSVDISETLMVRLHNEFDMAVDIDTNRKQSNLGQTIHIDPRIFCWKLTVFKKCVFVHPDLIVLKNCDELFEREEISAVPCTNDPTQFDGSLFVFKPSWSTFKEILTLAENTNSDTGGNLLNTYFKAWNESSSRDESHLPSLYNQLVKSGLSVDFIEGHTKIIAPTKPWIKILICECNNEVNMGQTHFEDIVSKLWTNIYLKVSPFTADKIENLKLDTKMLDMIITKDGDDLLNSSTVSHLEPKNNIKVQHEVMKKAIAVVGLSCRFPGANNPDEFWKVLLNKEDRIIDFPPDRKQNETCRETIPERNSAGFLNIPVDEFDAKFFGISPREADCMDPQQRLLLEVAWEALENAAINPRSLKGSNTGVYTGLWTRDYETIVQKETSPSEFHRAFLGTTFSATSARISYHLKLNGPNIATESGCSSSLVSLHLACENLLRNESNLAIAGGVNMILSKFPQSSIPLLANDGHCKTFDAKADGFARGEGCGVLILKRYSDAIRDGDRVMAVIRGSAVNSEGTTGSFGTPSKHCQQLVIQQALQNANVNPGCVNYVEMHGTGTEVGDPIEFAAVSSVYSQGRVEPLYIGSVKTNIGHTEAAAGVAGLIKVILSIQYEIIPPHRNFDTINPHINLESIPAIIPTSPQAWKLRKDRTRYAAISSFGLSGTNVHLVLQEPPILENSKLGMAPLVEPPEHIIAISAKNETALEFLVIAYEKYLSANPNICIGDVAFSANIGRAHFKHRIAVKGKNAFEIQTNLLKQIYDRSSHRTDKNKLAFVFTGQGCQYEGMASILYESNATFKKTFLECAELFENHLGISLVDSMLKKYTKNDSFLHQTIYSQTSIFCVQYSLLKMWESLGVKPDFVLGHSVGEFAAAVAASVLSLADAVKLLSFRTKLIHNLPAGSMLALRTTSESAVNLIASFSSLNTNDWIDIAVINSNSEVIVSGKPHVLQAFTTFCTQSGIKTQALAACHAFHSRDMDSILSEFGHLSDAIDYGTPQCHYVSGSTGQRMGEGDFTADYWKRHCRESVDFTLGFKRLRENGCNVFIEIGPHPILLALGMANLSASDAESCIWLPSMRRNENEWTTVLSTVSKLYTNGIDLKWEALFLSCSRNKLALPTYPFQKERFWLEPKAKSGSLYFPAKHPLLGRKLSMVSKDITYYNTLDLETFPYLIDHQVGDKIILPGAAYFEIILAAGFEIFSVSLSQSTRYSLVVENFQIEAPLEIKLEAKRGYLVVASSEDGNIGNSLTISVYFSVNLDNFNENNWKRFAKANLLLNSLECKPVQVSNCVNLEEFKSENEPQETTSFYRRINEVGICFGKAFQSISYVWKSLSQVLAEILVPFNAGNIEHYIYHPIVLDAMFQTFASSLDESNNNFYLPIAIDKFEHVSTNKLNKNMFAHASFDNGNFSGNISLYDSEGGLLAIMSGVHYVKTNIKSVTHAVNAQIKKLPGLYKLCWRSRDGPIQARVDLAELSSHEGLLEKSQNRTLELNEYYEKTKGYSKLLNKYCCFNILKIFTMLECKFYAGMIKTTSDIIEDLVIKPGFTRLIDRFLEILGEDGYLKRDFDSELQCSNWELVKSFPSLSEIDDRLTYLRETAYAKYITKGSSEDIETPFLDYMVENYINILRLKQTAVSVLFAEDTIVDVSKLYISTTQSVLAHQRMSNHLNALISYLFECKNSSTGILRILEVGAGTGGTTTLILKCLKELDVPFRYAFTDISPHFLSEAEKSFKNISGMSYSILDIENDPKQQGYTPFHYDIVIASNVIHATQNIKESVKNIRQLIRCGGIFLLQEITTPIRAVDMIFGTLDQYWCFKDLNIRSSHPLINFENWVRILDDCRFSADRISGELEDLSILCCRALPEGNFLLNENYQDSPSRWLLCYDESRLHQSVTEELRKSGEDVIIVQAGNQTQIVNDNLVIINPLQLDQVQQMFDNVAEKYLVKGIIYFGALCEDRGQEFQCCSLLYILQTVVSFKVSGSPSILFVTRGINYIGDQGKCSTSNATVVGIMKSFQSERAEMKCRIVDLDPDNTDLTIDSLEVISEIWCKDSEFSISYRNRKRCVARAIAYSVPQTLEFPANCERYCLTIPESKSISDLSFGSHTKSLLQSNFIEVSVKACALNFRDVLVILKPDMYHTLNETVGSDFSGVITQVGTAVTEFKVGDEVFGMSTMTAVASHITIPVDLVIRKPAAFSFADAATLPSVFCTAYHCLVQVGKLQSNETILIHVASGGVGLVAIQIATRIGAKIIATAGSKRKRKYLRSMGIQNVFHSRNTTYANGIQTTTEGKGVHMVLNSLTQTGFKEATLGICGRNARFIEIGKVNIWSYEDVQKLRPDVHYTVVDLEKTDSKDMKHITNVMNDMCNQKWIVPLPYTRFDTNQIREALAFFQKSLHIGKIVVTMPEINSINGKNIPVDKIFHDNVTYLITGGMGGIGFEVAKWMTDLGAKHIVLVGRTPPSDAVLETIKQFNAKGKHLLPLSADVGDWNQCQSLFQKLEKPEFELPPLRGVMHAAGILSDSVIQNQDWKKFKVVLNAKVNGGWNLHQLTKTLPLEHFVLFSSIAAVVGSPGQSNHCAANNYLDNLAYYRHSVGLPAQTINWGAWSEVGAALEIGILLGMFGIKAFPPAHGLKALKHILSHPSIQTYVVDIDEDTVASNIPHLATLLSENTTAREEMNKMQCAVNADAFWNEITSLALEDRIILMETYLGSIIRNILKLPEFEVIDEHQSFSEMGMDSLMAVEMRNRLQMQFGKYMTLNATSLLDYPTLGSLSKFLAGLTISISETKLGEPGADNTTTDSDLANSYELVKIDSILPESIQNIPNSLFKLHNILLTGATGHLGAYFLKELATLDTLNITCLLRGKSVQSARNRLISNLKQFDLLELVNVDKISIVLGNITGKNLGLSAAEYTDLAQNIDAIVHCAAKVNHAETYCKSKSLLDIRSVNTIGTLHILELASTYKTKRVVYPGSFSSVNTIGEDGFVDEEFPSVDNFGEGIKLGYSLSKLVGEKLMRQASERGIPCYILRYPSLIGHSETGLFTLRSNQLMSLLISFARLGVIPNVRCGWTVIPIDIAAKISCHVVLNEEAQSGLYNVAQPTAMSCKDLAEVENEVGIKVKLVNADNEFFNRLFSDKDNVVVAALKSHIDISNSSSFLELLPAINISALSEQGAFQWSTKIEKIIPGFRAMIPHPTESFNRGFQYAKRTGILAAVGIDL